MDRELGQRLDHQSLGFKHGSGHLHVDGSYRPNLRRRLQRRWKALATSSVDRTVKVWYLPRPGEPVVEPLTLYGNSGAVYHVAFSPDGTRLASAGREHIVHVYDLNINDLGAAAQAHLTRTLTAEEWEKYLHMAQCPALKANE